VSIKKDSEDYFNLVVKAADNSLAYLSYSETLIAVGESLQATGGEASSLAEVITQFETAQTKIDEAVKKLENTTPPTGMEQYNKDLIAALKSLSTAFGKINLALKSGDLAAVETYSNEVMTAMTKMTALNSPSSDDISKNILTADETKKLDELPAKITAETNEITKKTFAF
jgi:hypothetical protein